MVFALLPVISACYIAGANLTVLFGLKRLEMPGQMFTVPMLTKSRALNIRNLLVHRSLTPFLYTQVCTMSSISIGHSHFHSFLASPVALDGTQYLEELNGNFGDTWANDMIENERWVGTSGLHVYDSSFTNCQTKVEGGEGGQASFGLSGGALYLVGRNGNRPTVTIERSNFSKCTSAIEGGAIFANGLTQLDITESWFRECVNTKIGGSALALHAITNFNLRGAQFYNNEDKADYPATIASYDIQTGSISYVLMDGSKFTHTDLKAPADFTYQTSDDFSQTTAVITFECLNFINPTLNNNAYMNLAGQNTRFFLYEISFDKRSYAEAVSTAQVLALETRNIFENTYAVECVGLPETSEPLITSEIMTSEPEEPTSVPTVTPTPIPIPTPSMTVPGPTATAAPTEEGGIPLWVIILIVVLILIILVVVIIILLLLLCKKRRYAFIPPKADPLDEGAYEIPLNFGEDGL